MQRASTLTTTILRSGIGLLTLCAGLLLTTAALHAADRVWTDRSGNLLKAELTGVKDGKVMLRQDRKRLAIPLPQFTLNDRDEIISQFRKREQPALIEELVEAASEDPLGGTASGERLTSFYGLPLPSPQLLKTPEPRHWSDLTGRKTFARFTGVVAPAHVQLERIDLPAESATTTIPLAALAREDIEHVRNLLEADRDTVIFPDEPSVALTEDLAAVGFRTWTDRRGQKQTARFVKWLGEDVTLALPVIPSSNGEAEDGEAEDDIDAAAETATPPTEGNTGNAASEEEAPSTGDSPENSATIDTTALAALEQPFVVPLAGLSSADQRHVRQHNEGQIYERPAPPKPAEPEVSPEPETASTNPFEGSGGDNADAGSPPTQNNSVTVAQPQTGGELFGMQVPLWLKIAIGIGLLLFVGTWFRRQMA